MLALHISLARTLARAGLAAPIHLSVEAVPGTRFALLSWEGDGEPGTFYACLSQQDEAGRVRFSPTHRSAVSRRHAEHVLLEYAQRILLGQMMRHAG